MKRFLSFVLALSLLCLSGCGSAAPAEPDVEEPVSNEYVIELPAVSLQADIGNQRVFYEIFPGSFSDSDGDGTGDLRGIINRLDYLNDGDPDSGRSLGIGGIWLTPVFASPSYHKYDVADYFSIDPSFGTMADMEELIAECHRRDVLLILDLPINHSSGTCDWFTLFAEARKNGDTSSPYYDFYSCYDTASGETPSGSYSVLNGTSFMYESNFSYDMPEFNFDSPAVRAQLLEIAKLWLDKGVDGFRFDAAKYVYLGDNNACVEFWDWYCSELRGVKPDIYMVAEVWDNDSVTGRYFSCVNCFDFYAAQAEGLIALTAKHGDVNKYTSYVQKYISSISAQRSDAFPVFFVANHDTDRAAGYLTVASGFMQMAANLYILSPGSPFIYYGEELGMRGSRGGANTDANRRLGMLWGDGDTVCDPEGATYSPDNQISSGAAQQLEDPNSLYTYYKKLIALRRACPEIACGEYTALSFSGTKLGGFVSSLDGSEVAVIHNPTTKDITIDLAGKISFLSGASATAVGMGTAELDGTQLTLSSMTSAVIR